MYVYEYYYVDEYKGLLDSFNLSYFVTNNNYTIDIDNKILIIDKGKIIKNTSLREIKEDKNFKSLEDLFISITDKNLWSY